MELEDEEGPRRSPRRAALAPLDNTTLVVYDNTPDNNGRTTPISPDEFIIENRGRRRPPITWSPVEYNKSDVLGPPRDRTPQRLPQRADINSKLRRRLTMSVLDDSTQPMLGNTIEKKLKAISDLKYNIKTRAQK